MADQNTEAAADATKQEPQDSQDVGAEGRDGGNGTPQATESGIVVEEAEPEPEAGADAEPENGQAQAEPVASSSWRLLAAPRVPTSSRTSRVRKLC